MQQQQISREYFTTRTYPFLVYIHRTVNVCTCVDGLIYARKNGIHIFGGGSIKLFCAKATPSIYMYIQERDALAGGRRRRQAVWCV